MDDFYSSNLSQVSDLGMVLRLLSIVTTGCRRLCGWQAWLAVRVFLEMLETGWGFHQCIHELSDGNGTQKQKPMMIAKIPLGSKCHRKISSRLDLLDLHIVGLILNSYANYRVYRSHDCSVVS